MLSMYWCFPSYYILRITDKPYDWSQISCQKFFFPILCAPVEKDVTSYTGCTPPTSGAIIPLPIGAHILALWWELHLKCLCLYLPSRCFLCK